MMRKLSIIMVAILFGYIIFDSYTLVSFTSKDSQLFYNGHILTMENDLAEVDAVYVEDGIIHSIGDEDKLRSIINNNTEMIDLRGKTILPGFIDPHTHPIASAFLHGMIDLSGFKHDSKEEVWSYFEEGISQFEPGEWILCKGFDQVLVNGLLSPHISYLDSISPNNPVFIISLSMHSYWANSIAFNAAGIDKYSVDPSESSFYEKDAAGNLTGYIVEQEAFKPFKESMIKALGNDLLKEKSVAVLEEYASNGNTTITAMGITTDDPNIIRLYEHLSSKKSTFFNRFLLQLGLLPERKPTVRHFVFVRSDAPELIPKSADNGDDFFKMVGVKFWYDGSPYTGTMYIDDPYLENNLTNEKLHYPHSHSGEALLNQDDFKQAISQYQDDGWQIAVHAQGDAAIREVLDAFESGGGNKDADYRHRLEHCLLLENESIKRMYELNIHPSFHINHLYYYGEILSESIIGDERTETILPVKNAEYEGLTYSIHADQPMFESNPLALVHTAVNRKTRDGKSIGSYNKVSVESALKAVTINAAWQIKMEDKIGSIKVGKYADFVILAQNPFEVSIDKIKDIQILETIVNGNTIFRLKNE